MSTIKNKCNYCKKINKVMVALRFYNGGGVGWVSACDGWDNGTDCNGGSNNSDSDSGGVYT